MTTSQYIFTDAQRSREWERLQAIEQIFDPASQRRIQLTGMTQRWRCLEVGAGAGSITRWLAAAVGEDGHVTAVDLDTRFVADLKQPNIEVLEADIRQVPLEEDAFDLVHARCVLLHIADFQAALTRMVQLLKPGGWMVLEEPDFSAARAVVGEPAACEAVERVNQAILQMFADRGMDSALGIKLPAIVRRLGLQQRCVENEALLTNGGWGVATMMKMSTLQLAEKYIATGAATQKDLEEYCQFAENQSAWAIYHAMIGVVAQKAIG